MIIRMALCAAALSLSLFAQAQSLAEGRTLLSGAALPGANGVRFSPAGELYVTSAVGSRIEVRDPESGRLLRSLGQADGVLGADDLDFGPDGRLYWSAFFTGEVMRMNADGSSELVARVGPGVNAMSFSADGRLFVTRVFLADELYEVFPDSDKPPRLVAKGLGGLNAMDFGADGKLYGPLWFKGQVARIDVDSGELDVVAAGLDTPAAVKFSPEGVLHVIDQHQGTVLALNTDDGTTTLVARPGLGADNLDFDAQGRLYISNAHEGSLSRALPNGMLQALTATGLAMPAGVAVNAEGELVVAAAQSLRRYDATTGAELAVHHASIGDPRAVATPLSVAAAGDRLLVSSWFSNTVQLWDPASGAILASYRDYQVPLNAVAMGDAIIVAELVGHRISRRVGDGAPETLMPMKVPAGLAAANGDLYAADWLVGTIYQLYADGVRLDAPSPVASGLKFPEGMAIDPQGRLLVVETGSQSLLRIDPRDGSRETLAEGLKVGLKGVPGYPPTWLMSSVAVDGCGRITVTQDLDNSLLRVVPITVVAGVCAQ